MTNERVARLERAGRWALWAILVVAWVVAVAYMWDAMSTMPSAERLQNERVVAIPTPRSFFAAAAFSGMELAVVLAALWPRWPALWATRLGCTVLALVTWFIMTTTMDINRMDWVHRRWLAFTTLAVFAALLVTLAYRLAVWVRTGRHGSRAAGADAARERPG